MLVYIIKTVACLAILLVFYKLFLEKESVHQFKRFYLLGALLFSLVVPVLVFTEYIEAAPIEEMTYIVTQPIKVSQDVINVPPALEADVLDIEPILWGIYFLGLIFFGIKFIRNLFQIFYRIRKNPKHKLTRFTQVLLQEKITPHTFFSYIFLNKLKFEANEIPKEVILHEETHASQKHSLDVILIEFLQVIFWVNPFIYLTKKAIKLNHEFLADQAVLKNNIDKSTYQNTLLSYLSPDSEKKYQPLANAINYSSIKKRFTVMKTHTSKKGILLRSLLLLPLLAILIYGFSETNFIQKETTYDASTIINDVNIEIDKNGGLLLNNEPIALADVAFEARQLNASLEPFYFRNYVTANILYNENYVELIELVEYELHEIGISNIEHTSKKTSTILNQKGFTPSLYNGKNIAEARALRQEKVFGALDTFIDDETPLEIAWIEIKNENEIWFENELIDLENLAKKIAAKYKIIEGDKRLEVQIYATGILHSDFVDNITKEVEKAGAKRVQVMSEEYIMHENQFLEEGIDPETASIRLKTHRMTLVQGTKSIEVNINKKGQLLVEDEHVKLENLEEHLSKINTDLKVSDRQKFIKSIIQVDIDSPKDVIDQVVEILSKYSDPTIQPTESDFFKIANNEHTARSIEVKILKNGNYSVDGIKTNKNQLTTIVNTLHQDITEEIRNDIMNIHVSSTSEVSKKEVWFLYNSLKDYGFYRLVTPNKEVVKGKGNTPFKISNSENKLMQEKEPATEKQLKEYNTLAKKYNTMLSKSKSVQIKKKDVDRLEYIYGLMSKKQKTNAEPFPDFPPLPKSPIVLKGEKSNIPPPPPPKAPKVKKVEKSNIPPPPKAPKVLKGEVSNIPPPPKGPKPPKVLKGKVYNQDMYGDENVRVYQHNVGETKTASPNLLKSMESLVKRDAQFYFEGKKVSTKEGLRIVKNKKNILIETHPYVNKKPEVQIHTKPSNVSVPEPPAPPEPVSPLDHVIEMAKKNAKFYLEGKEITSDKAIEVMKNNKDINIDSRSAKNKRPVVKMSTKPIRIN
jgi:beta-lactamase regulating signal transducer with metallopeptidase domain/biopolymer transport protein ExbD